MNSSQLKEEGNAFIQQGKFQEALGCYTEGLKLDPSNHILFSNRSLAHYRLGNFEDALSDADSCIRIAPTFGRGYLRRATVLNSLRRFADAMLSAEEGYKVRQSSTVCRDCVSQWLTANQAIYQKITKRQEKLIPPGCLILSEKIGDVILRVGALRFSAAGMTSRSMQESLKAVTEELEKLLGRFGHSGTPCLQVWCDSLPLTALVDPETDRIPDDIAESIIQKGSDVARWLSTDVDPVLYPVVGPVVCLYSSIVSNRSHALSAMNSGHQERAVICKSVLPFHSKELFGGEQYIAIHAGLLMGLLGTFLNRRIQLSESDSQELKKVSHDTKALLEKLPASLGELKKIGLRGVADAEWTLTAEERSTFLTGSIELGAKELFRGMSKSEVVSLVTHHMAQVQAKPPVMLTLDYPQHMLRAAYILTEFEQNQLAVQAFHVAERLYFKIFGQKMALGIWSVDEMASIIAQPRSMVLEVADKLAQIDVDAFIDAVVRWKCLHTEFAALLMQVGMGAVYQKTYRELFESQKEFDQRAVLQVASDHRQGENKLAELHGPTVLSVLFTQSSDLIQKVLEKDEVVLDYCSLGASIVEGAAGELRCAVVLIKPEGKPIVEVIPFDEVFQYSNQWHPLVSTAADTLTELSPEANRLSRMLCDLLFPPKVREVIESDEVKRVFLCPEVQIADLPLDLLLFPDDKMLFQKCAVTLLSSSRELIRYDGGLYLKKIIHQTQQQKETCIPKTKDSAATVDSSPHAAPTTSSMEHSTDTQAEHEFSEGARPIAHSEKSSNGQGDASVEKTKSTSTCVIFANPNFDLEAENTVTKALADAMKSVFGILFRSSVLRGPVVPLPATEEEATNVEQILSTSEYSLMSIKKITKDDANVKEALDVQSPVILHFATHAFSATNTGSYRHQPFGMSFWASTTSGLLLAGANTCRSGNYDHIVSDAGSGQLTGLSICGMNLKGTRLVYLSACSSSAGRTMAGESSTSLSQAFRAAGANTIIATRWPVDDTASKTFSAYFYEALCRKGVHPSEALVSAKAAMQQDPQFSHWFYWAPYVCMGYDFPIQ